MKILVKQVRWTSPPSPLTPVTIQVWWESRMEKTERAAKIFETMMAKTSQIWLKNIYTHTHTHTHMGVGCQFLLQRIFPIQGMNPYLLHPPALAGGFFTTSTTSVYFSHSVVSNYCPLSTPGDRSNSCLPSWWWHPTISSSVIPFSSCLQSIPASGVFFSSKSVLHIRWPKYWSFSFSINPSNEYSGLISLGLTGLISLQSKGLSKNFLQHHCSKASMDCYIKIAESVVSKVPPGKPYIYKSTDLRS